MKSEAIGSIGLLLIASVVFLISYQLPGDIFLSFGPNDFSYVTGFREDFEIRRAHLHPLVSKAGPCELAFCFG